MTEEKFEHLNLILRNVKNLTKDESKVLIKIIGRGGLVTASDVADILEELKLSNPVSRPYNILKNLESKGVLFEEHGNITKNKTYHAIHPRDLLLDVRSDLEELDSEIGLLEQPKEVPSKKFDPREETKILKNELGITTEISECIDLKDTVQVFINNKLILLDDPFYKKLAILIKPIKIEESKINCILVSNIKKEKYIVIFIFKVFDQTSGKIRYFGTKIIGKEIFDFTKSGIEKWMMKNQKE